MDNKYVGSLPTTIFAQSGELDNYRIYGTLEGAGAETETIIYGWHVDPSISDSANAIMYLGDAIGKTPAAMGTETFSYGDWSDAFFMPKPCMVKSDGTVDYYLDTNDYTKKADGTASDVADPNYDGNAMMEWPLIWWKYEAGETEGEGYFYVANRKPDDTYHCWCNYDADDNITEHFYTAIYNGTGIRKMRSISGVALTNANGNGDTTATQEITRATANNSTNKTEWYIDVWSDRMLINGLLILMGKSLNSQAVFGRGLDTGGQSAKEAYVTGTLNDKGLFWGVTANGDSGVKVFGMENYWGCVWRRTAGMIGLTGGGIAYKLTYGIVDGTTADGYNTTGEGYLIDGAVRPTTGYFKTAKFGQFGYLPLTTGASFITYFSDYWYLNDQILTFALVGGDANNRVNDGCSFFALHIPPDREVWYISSSLSFKPLAKTIPDTDINPHGYKLPLTVESGETENLWNLDSSWTNGQTDTRAYLQLRLMQYNGSTLISSTNLNVGANGHYTIQSSLADANYTHIYLRHNGSVKDLPIGTIYGDFKKDKRYIISLDVLGYDPTIVGGIKLENIMLTEGSTPPDHYIPHRYTSDISIYIGDSKLGKEEYVDYESGKIYRVTSGALTPTDPPVPLPPIPTYKGENTISSTETISKAQFNWTVMEIASTKMSDNTYYDFKDTWGRAQLSEIQSWIDSQESSISTIKVGLQVDYQNKTNTRLNIPTIDPNTGLPFTFDSLSIYSNRRRCNVNDAGEITAWYGDEDYIEDGSNGQVMVYQPKFYYRVEPVRLEEQSDGLGYHVHCANYWISEAPITGFRVHPAFINEDGNEVDYYLTGAYEASIYDTSESTYLANDEQVASFADDLLCSIANVKPASGLTQNLTRANCELMAKNRGNVGWHNTTVQIESAEQLLMMIELGTMNFQSAIGAGVTSISDNSSYNCSALTGSTSILGNVSGHATSSIITKGDSSTTYTANGYVSISYRGRENPYGNIWKFVEGMIVAGRGESKGGIPFICNDFAFPETSSTAAGSSIHDFTLNGYTSAGFTIANAVGYISAIGYGDELYDWLFVASECSGNSTNPVGDYTYPTTNLNGTLVTLLGGGWNSGARAGSFCWYLHYALAGRNRDLGGRAALIPRKLTRSILA